MKLTKGVSRQPEGGLTLYTTITPSASLPSEGASYRLIRWSFPSSLSIRRLPEEESRPTVLLHARRCPVCAFFPPLRLNMVEMSDMVCLLVPLLMFAGSTFQADDKTVRDAEKSGNFMEDEQWLSTISQYSRKIKHWNRFRD
ncbi:hypothetical protein ILYODFUR_008157, partial [Ilyodon furcidens]